MIAQMLLAPNEGGKAVQQRFQGIQLLQFVPGFGKQAARINGHKHVVVFRVAEQAHHIAVAALRKLQLGVVVV